jgi:hypothetical protein
MIRALLAVMAMKASARIAVLAWVALGVFASACGGRSPIEPADGGSVGGMGGSSTDGQGGTAGPAGAGGTGGSAVDCGPNGHPVYCLDCEGNRVFNRCDDIGVLSGCLTPVCPTPSQCNTLDETTCKTRPDCTAQYCHVCPNQSTFAGCTAAEAPPVQCPAEACIEADCGSLNEASCMARSDCQVYACSAGCGGEPFIGCGTPGGVNACPPTPGCSSPPCSALNETTCKARSDCQPNYCSACGGAQTFAGCSAPGGETACPAIACVQACGTIMASDYDQSCATDADCVTEPEGDFCVPNRCTDCPNAVISVKAQAQYEADLASKIPKPSICPCPSGPIAVCNNGKCTAGTR